MIIPEDGCFPPITTSNLNSFNNTMVIKVANPGKGETTFQLATLNRSGGLCGWPADRYLNEFLPGHETIDAKEETDTEKRELNLLIDTTPVMPKLFCTPGDIRPKLKRNYRNEKRRKSLPCNSRYNSANRDSWIENRWEAGDLNKSGPPMVMPNSRLKPGLLGHCPVVAPLIHNASNLPSIPPRCNYPDFRGNHREQNMGTRNERGPGHHYRGNYSKQGTRHDLTGENYSTYTDTQRDHSSAANFNYDNGYIGNEAEGRSHVSPNMNNRDNSSANFNYNNGYKGNEAEGRSRVSPNRNIRDNSSANFNYNNGYKGNEAEGRSRVSPNMNNRNFYGRFRNPPNTFDRGQDGPLGYGNEELQANKPISSYQTNPSWQKNKYNSNKKNNFRGNSHFVFRTKRNSYLPFGTPSRPRRHWASPIRAPINPNRRNQRKRF